MIPHISSHFLSLSINPSTSCELVMVTFHEENPSWKYIHIVKAIKTYVASCIFSFFMFTLEEYILRDSGVWT